MTDEESVLRRALERDVCEAVRLWEERTGRRIYEVTVEHDLVGGRKIEAVRCRFVDLAPAAAPRGD